MIKMKKINDMMYLIENDEIDDENLNSSSNSYIIKSIVDDLDEFEKIDVLDVENLNDDELIDMLKLISCINYFTGLIFENVYENLIVEIYKRFNDDMNYLLYLNLCCLKYDIFLFSNFQQLNQLNIPAFKGIENDDVVKINFIIENYVEFMNVQEFNKKYDNLMYLSNYSITSYILYDLLMFEKNDIIEQYFKLDEFIDDNDDEFHVINNNYNEIIVDNNIYEN